MLMTVNKCINVTILKRIMTNLKLNIYKLKNMNKCKYYVLININICIKI